MSIVVKMRKQRATWWARLEPDQFGNFAFAEPVEIKCRWDDSQGQQRTRDGEIVEARSVAYVDRIMRLGDRLKEGEMDSETFTNPMDDKDTMEIVGFSKNPDIKNRRGKTLLTALLK